MLHVFLWQVSVNGQPVEGFLATIVILAGLVATVMIFAPLLRALARRIEGRREADPRLPAEVAELRDRVAELETREGRLAELEERLDFAERLLTRGPGMEAPARLPGESRD